VLPSKLYGVAGNPIHVPSLTEVILKLPAVHSGHDAAMKLKVGAILSPVYCSVSTKLVLQLFSASQEIAFKIVVILKVWLLRTVEPDVGVVPFVVYLTCVHPAHGLQLIVDVLPLNRYHAGVHVGAHVGSMVFIHVRVTVIFTVLFSLSLTCIVQLSPPDWLIFGV
jgi:hypothetical protein